MDEFFVHVTANKGYLQIYYTTLWTKMPVYSADDETGKIAYADRIYNHMKLLFTDLLKCDAVVHRIYTNFVSM